MAVYMLTPAAVPSNPTTPRDSYLDGHDADHVLLCRAGLFFSRPSGALTPRPLPLANSANTQRCNNLTGLPVNWPCGPS